MIITGRSADRLGQAMTVLGGQAQAVPVDSTDEHGTEKLFDDLGIVDHLFVAAGMVGGGGLLDADTASMRPRLDIRVWGAVYAATYCAPKMTRGGSITFCSGSAAVRPSKAGNPVAAASGGAVESLARALAIQLAPVRVNTVRPGLVDTPMHRALGDQREEMLAAAAKRLPVGRIGRPEDIAHAVLFLMENGYVTGTTLNIDGGGVLI